MRMEKQHKLKDLEKREVTMNRYLNIDVMQACNQDRKYGT